MNCFLTIEFKDEATELLPFISFDFLSDDKLSLEVIDVDVDVDVDIDVDNILVMCMYMYMLYLCVYKIKSGALFYTCICLYYGFNNVILAQSSSRTFL